MKGYYEESEEVRAKRELRQAARDYAAVFLKSGSVGAEFAALEAAAIRFAATQPKSRKRATPKRSGHEPRTR